jgi:hypothetical protein
MKEATAVCCVCSSFTLPQVLHYVICFTSNSPLVKDGDLWLGLENTVMTLPVHKRLRICLAELLSAFQGMCAKELLWVKFVPVN